MRNAPKKKRAPKDVAVVDIMTADVLTVRADTSIDTVMALLVERNISGAPVVDDEGRAVGMVSKTDLVRDRYLNDDDRDVPAAACRRGHESELGPGFHSESMVRATVGEVMTPVAFTLPEGAGVSQAAALMAYENVHRIPVVDTHGFVTGIVSSIDVLRWLALQSGYAMKRKGARPQAV